MNNSIQHNNFDPDKQNSIVCSDYPWPPDASGYEELQPIVDRFNEAKPVPVSAGSTTTVSDNVESDLVVKTTHANDAVNHPSHYTYGTIETIDYIEDKGFTYNLGNAIKYISRAGHKIDAIEDLRKAVWYVQREIQRLTKEKNNA